MKERNMHMTKTKLKLMLTKYRMEILNGNNDHLKDLIGTMVLLELSTPYHFDFERVNYEEITLDNLLTWFYLEDMKGNVNEKDREVDTTYVVPSQEETKILRKRYETIIKDYSWVTNIVCKKAANTWIEMMRTFGMIQEGEVIESKDYVLTDYINDPQLKKLLQIDNNLVRN